MKNIREFNNSDIKILFTDIDGTLTFQGQIPANSYAALWKLHEAGIHVVPVTGRPAGWCEMIARTWPVAGVIGENGGLYFRYKDQQMFRSFSVSDKEIQTNRKKLDLIRDEVLLKIPGCSIASDQFGRLMDLAVDFAEDVKPLAQKEISQIVSIFEKNGAIAKVSNIHVNGWFGSYDKLSMCKQYLSKEFGIGAEESKNVCAFTGDSPNDEPMFEFFPFACAVSNINDFINVLKFKPAFVASKPEAEGFCEISEAILKARKPKE